MSNINDINKVIGLQYSAPEPQQSPVVAPTQTDIPLDYYKNKLVEENKTIKAFKGTPDVPNIDLGEVYTGAGLANNPKLAAKMAALNEPLDKSVGVTFPTAGPATQRVATARTLGINGPHDYKQFTYDINNQKGQASAGTNAGDTFVVDTGTGNAGLNIASSDRLRAMDGSEGNPAFFKSRYPALETVVAPFKVQVPAYNMEVESTTLDPDKLAFQVATMIGGSQLPMYIGYTNAGFDLTEPWYSTLSKGINNLPQEGLEFGRKAASGIIGALDYMYGEGVANDITSAWTNFYYGIQGKRTPDVAFKAEKPEWAKYIKSPWGYLEDALSTEPMQQIKEDWEELLQEYEQSQGTAFTEFTTEFSRFIGQAPSAVAQMALAWVVSAYTGPAAPAILGAIYGGSTYEDDLEALKDAPISQEEKRTRAFWGGAGSAILNVIGFETVFGTHLASARKWVQNYGGRLAAAAAQGAIGSIGEGATEWADARLQNILTMNMGDNQMMNRLSNETAAAIMGAIMGLWGITEQTKHEKYQIIKEQILAGNVKADAEPWIKNLETAVKMTAEDGILTKEQAFNMLWDGGNARKWFRDEWRKTQLGMLNRLNPDAIKHAKEMGIKQSQAFINELNALDQKTYRSLPQELDESTKVMTSRAMKAIGSLIAFRRGNFRLPKFEITTNGPMAYEPKTNTLFINPNATGEAIDIDMVQNRDLRGIDPVQRGILHELGHMIDAQLGRGTNFKDFLPTYFDAISKVYGGDKAQRVQGLMNKTGDRLEFAKSEKPEDVAEKQIDKLTGTINEKNTSEYFAYALGRLGKKIGEEFGFGKNEVADYIDAANILAQSLKIPSIQKSLDAANKAFRDMIVKNDKVLQEMAEAMGEDGLARAIQDFVAGDKTALSKEDVIALYKILKSYTGVDGNAIIERAFQGVRPETYMQRARREFRDAIRETDMTIGEIQDALAKREGLAPEGMESLDTNGAVNEETIDISDLIKQESKENISALEKRAAEKPDGMTYSEDVDAVMGAMKEHGKSPKWFTKFFGQGDLVTGLWALGGRKLVDHFDLIGRMNRASTRASDMMAKLDEGLKKEMGWKSNIQRDEFNNNAAIQSIEAHSLVDPLTKESLTMKISPLVAMNLYLTAQSKVGRQKVINTFGGDIASMEEVFDALTPEQKKYAEYLMKFVKDNWSHYKKSFEQEGDSLEPEPYWPIADAWHIAIGDRRINSSVARKQDTDGMISTDVDAREVLNTYVQRTSGGEENVYSTLRRMSDLFGYRPEDDLGDYPTEGYNKLKKEMLTNMGRIRAQGITNLGMERRYDQFVDLINDFLKKRESSLVGSEALNIAARNLTSGLLMYKPIQFVKNLTNVSMFWGLVDNQGQYWKDTAWAVAHPKEAAKYVMDKVPLIRERLKGQNIDEALTQQTAGNDSLLMEFAKKSSKLNDSERAVISKVVALTQAARRLGFTPMLAGDAAANIIGGYGVLKQYEAKYGDRAGDKLSEDIVMRQASNNQATRSLLQREWSRDIRGEFLRFASEPKQKAKSIALDVAQAQKGEITPMQATKRILSTLSGMIMFALVSAGAWDLFDDDEENNEAVYDALTREGISSIFGASVVGNSILAPILTSPFTGSKGSFGTPLSTILSTDLYKLSKGEWRDLALDGLGATAMPGIKSLANRGRGAYEAVTADDAKELRSGLMQLGGREQRYAEERAGIKKEKVEKKSKK